MTGSGDSRVAEIAVRRYSVPLEEPFSWSTGFARARGGTLFRLTTRAGIVGWGEALDPLAGDVVERTVAPLLAGADASNPESLRAAVVRACRAARVGGRLTAAVAGGLEIASLDAAAKHRGRALHELVGTQRRSVVRGYASGFYYRDGRGCDELAAEAAAYVRRGFRLLKLKIGRLTVDDDARRVEAVRNVLPRGVELAVDGNQAYDEDDALRMIGRLEAVGARWFEEPLPVRNARAYERLAQRGAVPLAAGEGFWRREQFARGLIGRSLRVAQPNVGTVGGVRAALSVARLADRSGAEVALHGWGAGVLQAVAAHVASCLVSEPLLEVDCTPNPLRVAIAPELGLGPEIAVPGGPGLGISVDEDALAAFAV